MGLIGSGKTVALYQLKMGEPIDTLPTIDFVGESFTRKEKNVVTLWEIGGNVTSMLLADPNSDLWEHYIETADAVIWMVDSTPKYVRTVQLTPQEEHQLKEYKKHHHHHALRESRTALHNLDSKLKQLSCKMPLGVVANKQDLPGAFNARHVAGSLAVEMLHSFTPVYVQSASVQTTSSQMMVIVDWICKHAKARQKLNEKV